MNNYRTCAIAHIFILRELGRDKRSRRRRCSSMHVFINEGCYYGAVQHYISYFLRYLYVVGEVHRRGMSV